MKGAGIRETTAGTVVSAGETEGGPTPDPMVNA